ncbi:MAG: hypothetical protein JHD16_08090 [Solirubrobacteraceae bacterium]|nr:hypothetical protein [Solirubrobacteraceae bacterium]
MTGGLRSLLSGVLLVIATAAAVVAIWCVWAERQLLDTATFTTRSVEVIRDPAVREETAAFLAGQLVDQQEAVRQAAGQLPPELRATVDALLDGGGETAQATALEALETGAFDGLWGEAMTGTHGAFVQWLDDPGQGVELDLQPLIERLARDVGLPDQLIAAGSDASGAGAVRIIEAGQYEQTREFARRLERGAALMAPLALVAAVLSVLVARRRRWAVVRAGAGAALAGVIAAVSAPWIGDQLVAALADDGAATAVAQAIWASVEPPLSQLALLVVAAGTGVALLATIAWPGRARADA